MFQPVYIINDWGTDATFIGTHAPGPNETHSIGRQRTLDLQIDRPCTALVRYPDGHIARVRIEGESHGVSVPDMGHVYHATTAEWFVRDSIHGAEVRVGVRALEVDPETVVFDG